MSRLLARPGIPLLARGGVALLYKPWPRVPATAAEDVWAPAIAAETFDASTTLAFEIWAPPQCIHVWCADPASEPYVPMQVQEVLRL
jgi:hypothetical protein